MRPESFAKFNKNIFKIEKLEKKFLRKYFTCKSSSSSQLKAAENFQQVLSLGKQHREIIESYKNIIESYKISRDVLFRSKQVEICYRGPRPNHTGTVFV